MNTYEMIKEILREISGVTNIDLENTLKEGLGIDSLGLVSILIEIEENFNVTLNESDMNPNNLETVQHVVWLVEKYTGGSI